MWVGAERDVQDCGHKGRLSIAILNDGNDGLMRSAAKKRSRSDDVQSDKSHQTSA